jgi:hypothetical protein
MTEFCEPDDYQLIIILLDRERSAGITTGYRMGDRGSIPAKGKRLFSTPESPY